jgi:hypothetical protein
MNAVKLLSLVAALHRGDARSKRGKDPIKGTANRNRFGIARVPGRTQHLIRLNAKFESLHVQPDTSLRGSCWEEQVPFSHRCPSTAHIECSLHSLCGA